ncbi:MAG: ATP-binding protein [Clostridia bacterium]
MELTRGVITKARKCVVYGPEGIGKSTFASCFPEPVFCDTEGGTHDMDVVRTPTPTSWTMQLEIIRKLIADPSGLLTFVLDTADWAERLCIKHVCDTYKQPGIESFGYGKGYMYVFEEYGKLLDLLSELVNKSVNVVVIAHATLRKFEQPDEMGSYDRYELKLSKKTGAGVADMLKEWCDLLLFANYKTIVINIDNQGAVKGKNKAQGGKRVMYTTHSPSWDAKNRQGLPDELPFEFAAIAHLFSGGGNAQRVQATPPCEPRKEPITAHADPAEGRVRAEAATRPQEDAGNTVAATPPQEDAGKAEAVAAPPSHLPKALYDLMRQDNVTEFEIMYAVAQKGYYPNDTPIANYDPDFVSGVLVGAWPQVRSMVLALRNEVPF